MYVFGHEGGRIRAEDVVAFVRFKQAYRISPESVLFVFNKASSKLNFEKKESSVFFARTQIAALLGSNECDSIPYVFLPNFGEQFHLSDSALNGYRQTLLSLIYSRTPRSYRLESELKFDWEEVHAVKKEMSILMESMEKQHETFLSTAAQMKAENERAVAEANRRTDEILAASARAQEQQRQQIEEYQRANSANLQNSLNSVGPLLTVAAAFVPEVSVPIMLMQQAMAAGINPTAPNRNQNWNPVNYLIPKPPPFAGAPLEIPSTPNCILS